MRDPRVSLLIGLNVAALGFCAILWAGGALDIGFRPPRMTYLPGFILLALGLWLAVRTVLLVRLRHALLRGEGAIALWQVSASEWEAWRAHDAERSAAWSTLSNKLRLADTLGSAERETVAIGESAIAVGRAVVPLNVTGFAPFAMWRLCDVSLLDGPSTSLEFSRFMSSKSGAWIELVRIPVGHARGQAQRVLEHFASAIPERHVASAHRTFPTHFQAKNGDIAGAYDSWRKTAPGRHAFFLFALGVVGLIIWYSLISAQSRSDLGDEANLLLIATVAVFALAASFGLLGHWRRQ